MRGGGLNGFPRRRIGDIRWEIQPGMEDHLLYLLEEFNRSRQDRRLMGLRDTPAGADAFKLKTNRPGLAGELFVKVYPRQGRDRYLGLLGQSTARREWKMAFEHTRRGLPVARHLARGVRGNPVAPSEEYVVQESLTGLEPLSEYLHSTFLPELPGVRPQDKRRVIKDLAELVRKMHDRGISRPGMDPKNIMAAPRSGGGVSFVFVDLARARLRKERKGFSPEERLLELARFHKSFSPLLSQSYRLRFYREYFRQDDLDHSDFQEMVKKIITLSSRLARREEKYVTRAVKQREDPFFWCDYNGERVFMRKPLYQNSVLEIVDRTNQGEALNRVRVKRVGGEPPVELLLLKLDAGTNAGPRHGPPRRGFIMSALLDHHGISHYRVMAALQKKDGSGFMLSSVPGRSDYNLAEYLARRVAEEFSGLYWDRKFLIRVARFMMNLHEAGWYFPRPAGDDIWIRTTEDNTHEVRLLTLHKLRPLLRHRPELYLRNIFDLWHVLPISQADGIVLAEEYMRFSPYFGGQR
ncbi:MAG: lipopolysaccharide kinase InaA family protein, partial [bacterium]